KDAANGETIRGLHLREGIEGEYKDIIIAHIGKNTEAPVYVDTEDGTSAKVGTSLTFGGNISYNIASYVSSMTYYVQLVSQKSNPQFVDPAGFNFALQSGSPALTGGVTPPADNFLEQIGYSGAFGTEDWTREGSWVRWE